MEDNEGRMPPLINGLDMAVKNANDGISMISTAEGALGSVQEHLEEHDDWGKP